MRFKKLFKLVLVVMLIVLSICIVDKLVKANKKIYTYTTYIVAPGETLWDISVKMCPSMDPRKVVFLIREKNDITPVIYPGQEIQVPILNN